MNSTRNCTSTTIITSTNVKPSRGVADNTPRTLRSVATPRTLRRVVTRRTLRSVVTPRTLRSVVTRRTLRRVSDPSDPRRSETRRRLHLSLRPGAPAPAPPASAGTHPLTRPSRAAATRRASSASAFSAACARALFERSACRPLPPWWGFESVPASPAGASSTAGRRHAALRLGTSN